jgi:hypothetical protein
MSNRTIVLKIGQAYTNELENKVSRLEEENDRLKKQKVSCYENDGFVFSTLIRYVCGFILEPCAV